jgi:hypothetical protein
MTVGAWNTPSTRQVTTINPADGGWVSPALAPAAPVVLGSLVALVAVNVAAALVLNADGTRHPATVASVLVAVIIVLGGPLLLATARRRAVRTSAAA